MLQQGIEMKGICKAFSGVSVLQDVSLQVLPGEVHAILGENGAGKSTLMKILTGVYRADAGEIFRDGEKISVTDPNDAKRLGISMIHQELCLVPEMTVAENIFLGEWPKTTRRTLDRRTMMQRSQEILNGLGLNVRADALLRTLSIAQQQMVEIARAVSFDADVIIMDEPTSSLTKVEIDALMNNIRELRAQGVAIIYISHKMEELFAVCDRVTVMRDGATVGVRKLEETTVDELVALMVGREIKKMYTGERASGGDVIFEAEGLTNRYLKSVSFDLRRGEVLGIYGLVGAGRTELSRAIFGIDPIRGGQMRIDGQDAGIHSTKDAIAKGIALVPEDRKQHGLILSQSVGNNLTLPVMHKFIHNLHVDRKTEAAIVDQYKDSLSIKMTGISQLCARLSGGNQQKVVISKWLASEPRILILDEPTRGIDVGAKAEIYRIILRLASEGISIIMISSELPEILNLSSRVAVMHEGKIMAVLDAAEHELTSEDILKYAMGE